MKWRAKKGNTTQKHTKTSINVVTRDRRKRIFPRSVNKQRTKTPKVQSQIFNYNHSLFTENLKLTAKKNR